MPGRVRLGLENLEGDAQADLRVHGGPERALLMYAAAHYAAWARELPHELRPGAFGENLTVSGLDEDAVCIGDVFTVGSATIQVSEVRGPCYKLANHVGVEDMIDRVLATGRGGWYLRVLVPGELGAGDAMELRERPNPGWSVRRASLVYNSRNRPEVATAPELAELAALTGLSRHWRERLDARPAPAPG